MPKGPQPQWRKRDCSFDHLVKAAVEQGYGTVMVYGGIEDVDRAQDIRRGLYRCANHREISAEAGTVALVDDDDDDVMGIRKTGDTYELRFRMWSKTQARKAHITRHGTDRSQWPYDPTRPATDAERESWASRNELGQAVTHT